MNDSYIKKMLCWVENEPVEIKEGAPLIDATLKKFAGIKTTINYLQANAHGLSSTFYVDPPSGEQVPTRVFNVVQTYHFAKDNIVCMLETEAEDASATIRNNKYVLNGAYLIISGPDPKSVEKITDNLYSVLHKVHPDLQINRSK